MWVTATPARSSGRHPVLLEGLEEGRHRGLAAGLDQHRGRPLDEIAGGQAGPASEQVSISSTPGPM